jgi:hypothetical protein
MEHDIKLDSFENTGYDGAVPSSQNGTHEFLPCGLKWRRLVKLFKKANSRFYWFDFTVRGQRYRGSTRETKALMAMKVASMKLAHALEHGDLFLSWLSVKWRRGVLR